MAANPETSIGELRIRTGLADDLDDVMRIMGQAFHPCFGEGWTRSQCAGILPMAGVSLTIGEDSEGAVGFSLVRITADEAELLLIAVDPDRQQRGIGSLLLREFITSARSRGAERLHLEVREGNRAVDLYRAAGFVPAGRRRNYYRGTDGARYDAITLLLID